MAFLDLDEELQQLGVANFWNAQYTYKLDKNAGLSRISEQRTCPATKAKANAEYYTKHAKEIGEKRRQAKAQRNRRYYQAHAKEIIEVHRRQRLEKAILREPKPAKPVKPKAEAKPAKSKAQANREYYQVHAKEILEARKQQRQEIALRRKYHREYYAAHAEKIQARRKELRHAEKLRVGISSTRGQNTI